MAEPIIIVRENGLVIEIDLQDEQCSPPQVTQAEGRNDKITLRWADAKYRHQEFEVEEEDVLQDGKPTGRKQIRISPRGNAGSAGGGGGGGGGFS